MKDQPQEIEGIEVTNNIKYLGLTIENKRKYFKAQRGKTLEKAQKLANITYPIIAKSSNKLMVGKTYWKNVAMPTILYGSNIINYTETELEKLQRIENGVYRQILGAPKYATNSTFRGEVGASLIKRRIITGRIQYKMKILRGNNELLKKILELMTERNMRWVKETNRYMELVGIRDRELIEMSKEALKERTKKWDTKLWEEEIGNKSSRKIYREWKKEIIEEKVYDNRLFSVILYNARTNCLPLADRKRFVRESTECKLCGETEEDLVHFILYCPAFREERINCSALQQPYIENTDHIIGNFLFSEHEIETNKKVL